MRSKQTFRRVDLHQTQQPHQKYLELIEDGFLSLYNTALKCLEQRKNASSNHIFQ